MAIGENELKETIRQRVLAAIKELLESRHLYQRAAVSSDGLDEIIHKATEEFKKQVRRAGPNSSSNSPEENARAISEHLKQRLFLLLNSCWDFLPETPSNLDGQPIHLYGQGLDPFFLPTIRVTCNSSQCKGTVQPHNSGYPGFQGGLGSGSLHKEFPVIQIFSIPYHCQNCKEKPLIFLVKREGLKLILVGRSEFPDVLVPDFIPKEQRKFYRNAIVVSHANFNLAAALYLRTLIEQHFYQVIPKSEIEEIKKKGYPTGAELGELYAKTLPKGFPGDFPSLRKAYDDLSELIHRGKEDDAVYEKFVNVKTDVDKHFDALRVFNSILAK